MAAAKKLPKSLSKILAQRPTTTLLPQATPPRPPSPIPFQPPTSPPPPPLPTLSLAPATPSQLTSFLHAHFSQSPTFTPQQLLHFLHKKLRHHPSFAAYDLHVFRWASEVDSFRHDHSTFEYVVRNLAVTDRLDELRYVLGFMFAHPCPCSDGIFACHRLEHIYRFAINAFCRTGRVGDAEEVFGEMRMSLDGRPAVALYNVMMHGFSKRRRHEKVVEWYDRMVMDKVKPDVVSFNILIGSCFRCSRFDEGLELFKEMKAKGCCPNVVTFNTLISGFFGGRKLKEGIGVAHEMLDMGFQLSVVSCDILMDGLCRGGRVEEACEFLVGIVDRGAVPDGFDCLALVEALCVDGKVERAKEVVWCLWKVGRFPSVVTCVTLLDALRKSGEMDDACVLVEGMANEGMILDCVSFNGLAQALCDCDRTMDANRLRVLASRAGFRPDGATLSILVGGFSREGRRKEGEGVVDEMLDEGFIPNITVYNRLMEGLHDKSRSRW